MDQNHFYRHASVGLDDLCFQSFGFFVRQGLKVHDVEAGTIEESEIIVVTPDFDCSTQPHKAIIVVTDKEITRDALVWHRPPYIYNNIGYHIGYTLSVFLKHHPKTVEFLKSHKGQLDFASIMHWGRKPIATVYNIDQRMCKGVFQAGLAVVFGKNTQYDFGSEIIVERGHSDSLFDQTSMIYIMGIKHL